jgi:hypothetical protein
MLIENRFLFGGNKGAIARPSPRNRVSLDYLCHPTKMLIENRFLFGGNKGAIARPSPRNRVSLDYLCHPTKMLIEAPFLFGGNESHIGGVVTPSNSLIRFCKD